MEIQLICSDQIKEKIIRQASTSGFDIVSDAKIVLVERGHDTPPGKLAVVFDPIDYADALELLKMNHETNPISSDTITGFSNNRYVLIPIPDIHYIEAYGSGIMSHSDKETQYLKNTLQYYEELLHSRGFVRINKSQIVNMMSVKEIIPWFNARLVLVLKNNQRLEVSKLFSKSLRKSLDL